MSVKHSRNDLSEIPSFLLRGTVHESDSHPHSGEKETSYLIRMEPRGNKYKEKKTGPKIELCGTRQDNGAEEHWKVLSFK